MRGVWLPASCARLVLLVAVGMLGTISRLFAVSFANTTGTIPCLRVCALCMLFRYRMALADIRAVLAIDPSIEIANKAQHRIGGAVRRLKLDTA